MTLSSKIHKATKEYTCHRCRGLIRPGELYNRLYGGIDRTELHEMILCKCCSDCMTEDDRYELEAENDYCQSDCGNY